jgi:hypothetical protein
MVVQAVVVAGVEPVDVYPEPLTGHDAKPPQIQLAFVPVDRLPPPELKSPGAHRLTGADLKRFIVLSP